MKVERGNKEENAQSIRDFTTESEELNARALAMKAGYRCQSTGSKK